MQRTIEKWLADNRSVVMPSDNLVLDFLSINLTIASAVVVYTNMCNGLRIASHYHLSHVTYTNPHYSTCHSNDYIGHVWNSNSFHKPFEYLTYGTLLKYSKFNQSKIDYIS